MIAQPSNNRLSIYLYIHKRLIAFKDIQAVRRHTQSRLLNLWVKVLSTLVFLSSSYLFKGCLQDVLLSLCKLLRPGSLHEPLSYGHVRVYL
jgi:hypothetical protein